MKPIAAYRPHVALIALLLSWSPTPAPAQPLEAGFSDEGITSLKWEGVNLLKNGKPEITRVVFEKKWLNDQGINEFEFEKLDGSDPQVSYDPQSRTLTYGYPWGAVRFMYETGADRLDLTITLQNRTQRTLAMFDLTPMRLKLPEPFDRPKHWDGTRILPGSFNAVDVTFGQRKLWVGCETMMPLRFGFGKPSKKNTVLPVTVSGKVNILEPGGVVYHHYGLPRIEAGQDLTIKLSLRPADADADADQDKHTEDLVQAFRDYHRPRMVWEDRRPIGAIFIGAGRGPDQNPRNWFKDPNLDVRTDAGKKQLRERMMRLADRSIGELKKTNAQGMVLWDPEGGENPHPTTYIGDPRMVKLVAPEMVDIYPDFFQKFLDAGLRTGVCIRPTQVYLTPFESACDGDLDTRWSVQAFPQWLELDLGQEQTIDRTELICHADRAYQFKVEAKTADGQYAVIVDRTDNTTPGKEEAPITDPFEPIKARYVKLTVVGAAEYDGQWCSIREFRVFSGDRNVAVDKVSDHSRKFGRAVGGHGTGAHDPDRNPLGDNFDDIWPQGVPAERFYPIVERMSRKIEFAKKNWGCTLIYIDTNGVDRPVGEKQELKWTLLDPHIWRDLQQRHPDVLLIPEFAPNPGQLAYTTAYLQPPYSPPTLKPRWRDLLPGAFGVSYTVNLPSDKWDELRDRLKEGLEAGDSLFFRGWFGDHYNAKIKALYDEVYEPGAINAGLPEQYLKLADDQESP